MGVAEAGAAAEGPGRGRRGRHRGKLNHVVTHRGKLNHVVTQTSVPAGSVIDAGNGSATLQLFVSEQTKTAARQEAVLNENAIRVTMRDVNGNWLVAGLTPRS